MVKRNESLDAALKATEVENKRLDRGMDNLIESKEELQKWYGQLVKV